MNVSQFNCQKVALFLLALHHLCVSSLCLFKYDCHFIFSLSPSLVYNLLLLIVLGVTMRGISISLQGKEWGGESNALGILCHATETGLSFSPVALRVYGSPRLSLVLKRRMTAPPYLQNSTCIVYSRFFDLCFLLSI